MLVKCDCLWLEFMDIVLIFLVVLVLRLICEEFGIDKFCLIFLVDVDFLVVISMLIVNCWGEIFFEILIIWGFGESIDFLGFIFDIFKRVGCVLMFDFICEVVSSIIFCGFEIMGEVVGILELVCEFWRGIVFGFGVVFKFL